MNKNNPNQYLQVFILGILGVIMNFVGVTCFTYYTDTYNWTLHDCMLFGILLSTTDPVLSVASLKNVGK